MPKTSKNFKEIGKNDAAEAGGKGASLGEMTQAGIPVPPGFVVLADAFEQFLQETDLNVEIDSILHDVKHEEMHTVEQASGKIQDLILQADMPQNIADDVLSKFEDLNTEYVAVRSSATAEDSASAAWAGQLDTFLNTTKNNLLENVQKCWASLFTPRAIFYRFEQGLHGQHISVAVVVQKMVNSEKSGIAFSVHPVTEDYNQLIIEAGLGLGEAIVSGQVTPDSYVAEKDPRRIIDVNVSVQSRALYRQAGGGNEWKDLSESEGSTQVLNEGQILDLSKQIINIETHYGFPCDIEWAMEGNEIYITQSRPITTLTNTNTSSDNEEDEKKNLNQSESVKTEITESDKIPRFYKQAGEVGYYQLQVPAFMVTQKDMLSVSSGSIWVYYKKGYLSGLWEWDGMKRVAEEFLQKSKKGFPKTWLDKWGKIKTEVFKTSQKISQLDLAGASSQELHELYKKMLAVDEKMWGLSIFIDSFDPGFDREAIAEIASQHNFSKEEVATLLLPTQPSYVTTLERELHEAKQDSTKVDNFRNHFFWAGTNYIDFTEVDEGWIKTQKVDVHEYVSPQQTQNEILQKHGLTKNPFNVFQTLAVWRDDRKQLNYTGLYGRMRLLREGVRRLGIDPIYANYLDLDEVVDLFNGKLDTDTLLSRDTDGVLTYFKEDGTKDCWYGEEAIEKYEDLESTLDRSSDGELKGTIACKGKAKGRVRIVAVADDQSGQNFKEGDILVTSMTRPEFTPLMKKAAAIITDEGGVSSHAAIVSRELNKPCIIGTATATHVLNDGDEVEVDAEQGIVRVLSETKKHSYTLEDCIESMKTKTRWYNKSYSGYLFGLAQQAIAATAGAKVTPYALPYGFFFQNHNRVDHFDWSWDSDLLIKKRELILEEVRTSEKFTSEFYRTWHQAWQEFLNQWEISAKENFENSSVDEIRDKLNLLNNKVIGQGQYGYVVDAFLHDSEEDWLEQEIKKELGEGASAETIEILTAPVYESFSNEFEVKKLRIAKAIHNKVDKDKVLDQCRALADEFFWVRVNYHSYAHITPEDIYEEAYADAINFGNSITDKVSEEEKRIPENKIKKQRLIEELKLSSSLRNILAISEIFTYIQDKRKEGVLRANVVFYKALSIVAKKINKEFEIIMYLTPPEFLLKDRFEKIDWGEIEKRRSEGALLFFAEGEVRVFSRDEYEEKFPVSKFFPELDNIETINGSVAYRGKVTGEVSVVITKEDIDKFEEGGILVANQTTPEFVPAMKKAAAFITDQGGITCHAAIIAREMQKPCIIGTKIATKALSDGDQVEVDADNGIVKKL